MKILRYKTILISLILALLLDCSSFLTEGKENLYHVVWVVDGDTIKIEGGQLVRYIGIDTPERRIHKEGRWKYDPEPYAEAAKEFNEKLIKGRKVRLEFDVQKVDRFGRLLAYVYVDRIFVNEEMIRQGYAQLLTIPPNVRYVDRFKKALFEARQRKRGLWRNKNPSPQLQSR